MEFNIQTHWLLSDSKFMNNIETSVMKLGRYFSTGTIVKIPHYAFRSYFKYLVGFIF